MVASWKMTALPIERSLPANSVLASPVPQLFMLLTISSVSSPCMA